MPKFMISFNDGDMQIPAGEWEAVGVAAHRVMQEAIAAGVWVIGGGFNQPEPKYVSPTGEITPGLLRPEQIPLGGFTVVDVESEVEALMWAGRIASACRCSQEVREIMPDPEQDELLGVLED